jgi:hypothetical protein
MSQFRYFSDFPEDIQRLVFEYAFEGFEPVKPNTAAVDLALVSKQTNTWSVFVVVYQSR